MAQINFPALPAVGDLFTVPGTGVSYRWNGLVWLVQAGPGGGTGDFMASATTSGAVTGTSAPLIFPTVNIGNSGGWYNVSNGRYTPPAGRYFLSACLGLQVNAAGVIGCSIRKNGITPTLASGTSQSGGVAWLQAQADCIVDANGTDYFDVWVYSTVAVAATDKHWFGAFPLTGMQGPPGPPPLGSLSLYSENVLAAPANQILVTAPAGAKLVELQIDVIVTGSTSENINAQAMAGGSAITGTVYSYQNLAGQGTAAVAATFSGGAWYLGSAIRLVGSLKGSLAPGYSNDIVLLNGTTGTVRPSDRIVYTWELDLIQTGVRSTVTGFRIYTATAINFLAGSAVRCLVVV